MSAPKIGNYHDNGKQNGIGRAGKTPTIKALWNNVRINEWTFTLFLFVLSLVIVAGKLYIMYGRAPQRSTRIRNRVQSLHAFSHMYDVPATPNSQQLSGFDMEHLASASDKETNVSRRYSDAMAGTVVDILQSFGWLVRASTCGLAMMGYTWFIIYIDSSIPGVNPPSPFSPSKRRFSEKSRLQINYGIGVLNGILIFVYMCL